MCGFLKQQDGGSQSRTAVELVSLAATDLPVCSCSSPIFVFIHLSVLTFFLEHFNAFYFVTMFLQNYMNLVRCIQVGAGGLKIFLQIWFDWRFFVHPVMYKKRISIGTNTISTVKLQSHLL